MCDWKVELSTLKIDYIFIGASFMKFTLSEDVCNELHVDLRKCRVSLNLYAVN